MLSSFFGVLVALLGLWLGWIWRQEYLAFFKGCLAISLVLSGVIAIFMGLSTRSKHPSSVLHKKDHDKS